MSSSFLLVKIYVIFCIYIISYLAIIFIFNVGRYERFSITSLRNELNWLTASSRHTYFKLVIVHSLISFNRPPYLSLQFNEPDEAIRRSQRNLPDTSLSEFLPLSFSFI